MARVDFFISYSHKDEDKIVAIVASLEAAGAKCWYAPRDVNGRYAKAIVDAIANSKIFLLCLSKSSATSEHVLNEVEMAYNKKRQSGIDLAIEPLCLEAIDLDAPEFDEIMYYIRRINFISPDDLSSGRTIAREVIEKNRDRLHLDLSRIKEQRQRGYVPSSRESKRLKIQGELLRRFDMETYREVFSHYENPAVLDVGCGSAEAIMDRLNEVAEKYTLVGIDFDSDRIKQASQNYGDETHRFVVGEVEGEELADILQGEMERLGIRGFDIINISMVLPYLKSSCALLRKLRRLLSSNGTVIIKSVDDGLNFAYPDDNGAFERIYRIYGESEAAGDRRNGRQVFTNLHRAGFRSVDLVKSGLTTIGMSYEERESFWGMYFEYVLADIKSMNAKYPADIHIIEDQEWYEENYDELFESFMRDDFIFSLGYQIYVAKKQ